MATAKAARERRTAMVKIVSGGAVCGSVAEDLDDHDVSGVRRFVGPDSWYVNNLIYNKN